MAIAIVAPENWIAPAGTEAEKPIRAVNVVLDSSELLSIRLCWQRATQRLKGIVEVVDRGNLQASVSEVLLRVFRFQQVIDFHSQLAQRRRSVVARDSAILTEANMYAKKLNF